MTQEMFRAIMKEWYWIVIFLALILVAFAPHFLRSKCPGCKKRALSSVDVPDHILSSLPDVTENSYLVFFHCNACNARFLRKRSGPLEDASTSSFDTIYANLD